VRLLALTHRLPWAPNRGDRIRTYHVLRALATRHEVHLLSLVHDQNEAARAAEVREWLASVTPVPVPRLRNLVRAAVRLPGTTPLTFALLDAPRIGSTVRDLVAAHDPRLAVAVCSSMARLLTDQALASVPAIIDMIDVDSAKWSALAERARGPRGWIYAREARVLARAEAAQMAHALAVTVVNEREANHARALAPDADIRVVENGVDVGRFAPPDPPSAGAQVVFCGVMSYAPNAEAAEWLGREVWPGVRRHNPAARLTLVGSDPPAAVRRLADSDSSIAVTGHVPDVKPWLWESAVAAAPLRIARGIQNKVLEAVAAGLPCVVSSQVYDGLPEEIRPACEVADSADLCADRIAALLTLSPEARRQRARTAGVEALEWPRRLAPMIGLIDELESAQFNRRAHAGRAKSSS
jgi:sugar transferase (PEP-CTERM/EpsH1 system associated)